MGSRWSWGVCRRGAEVAEVMVAVDGDDSDFGRKRGSEGEEGMARERAREAWEARGNVWREEKTLKGQAGSCVLARTASGTASPLPTGKRRKTTMPLVGWARTEMGRPEAPGKFLPFFLFCFCFLFSVICFDLVIILNHFI